MKRHLRILAALLLTALPAIAQTPAPVVKLEWDYPDAPGVTFRLYKRDAKGEWVKYADVAKGREHVLKPLEAGAHAFMVRAVSGKIESPDSNELTLLAPPSGLRWSITITGP